MARNEASVSILSFDEMSASLVVLSPRDAGFEIERSDSRTDDPSALRHLAEAGAIAPDSLYTIIPRHSATVRILTLPSHDPDEIASMVALGVEEFAPYPREQLLIKHHILAQLPSGESRVFVALLHQEVVAQHVARLSDAALEPRQIFFSTACIHAAVLAAPNPPAGRFALVVVFASSLEVLVIDDGELRFSRGIAHHVPWDFAEAQSLDALGYEVRDALAAYRRESEDGQGADTVYVASECGDTRALAVSLQESSGRECHAALFVEGLVSGGASMAEAFPLSALGAAITVDGRAPMQLDLLPGSIADLRSMRGFLERTRRGALLASIVLIALLAWFGQAVVQRMLLIQELQTQIDALAPGAQGVAAKQQGLQTIARQVDRGGNFLELLSAVASAAPASDFNITRIAYDREEGMNLWGRALSKDLVLGDFLGNLRRLGEGSLAQLAQAHSQYETAGQERDQAIVNYQISIPALPEEGSDESAASTR